MEDGLRHKIYFLQSDMPREPGMATDEDISNFCKQHGFTDWRLVSAKVKVLTLSLICICICKYYNFISDIYVSVNFILDIYVSVNFIFDIYERVNSIFDIYISVEKYTFLFSK